MFFRYRMRVALRGGILLVTVYVSASGLLAVLWRVADGQLGSILEARQTGLPLDEALLGLSAAVLACCAGWLVLLATAVILEAVIGAADRSPTGRPDGQPDSQPGRLGTLCPPTLRRMLLAGCGVALCAGISGPAVADSSLDGLPVPDRVMAPSVGPAAVPAAIPAAVPAKAGTGDRESVRVRAGDTLWALAAQSLPQDASARRIAGRWREIYRMNAGHIGADPDLILPGTTLLLPTTVTPEREDRP